MEIDATDKSLGRLASVIAVALRGKMSPSYKPYIMPTEKVTVRNFAKIKLTNKKLDQKIYYHYSGYPGGMKAQSLRSMMEKDSRKALRLAVKRMLASNRLRNEIMKNLTIEL